MSAHTDLTRCASVRAPFTEQGVWRQALLVYLMAQREEAAR